MSRRLVAASLAVIAVVAGPVAPTAAQQSAADAQSACLDVIRRSGLSEDARRAMQDLMQSRQGPQYMERIVQLARQLGNGDVTTGLGRIADVVGRMGGLGGILGGQGATPAQPKP